VSSPSSWLVSSVYATFSHQHSVCNTDFLFQIYGLVVSVLIAGDRKSILSAIDLCTHLALSCSPDGNAPCHRIHPTRCGSFRWSRWSCCRFRYRNRRRCRCEGNRTATKTLCRNGVSSFFSFVPHTLTSYQILILIFAEVLGLYGKSLSQFV
jgi:hypothetical protein